MYESDSKDAINSEEFGRIRVGEQFRTRSEFRKAYEDRFNSPCYRRFGCSCIGSIESTLSSLECATWTILTSSGMAAIDIAIATALAITECRTLLHSKNLYSGTVI